MQNKETYHPLRQDKGSFPELGTFAMAAENSVIVPVDLSDKKATDQGHTKKTKKEEAGNEELADPF